MSARVLDSAGNPPAPPAPAASSLPPAPVGSAAAPTTTLGDGTLLLMAVATGLCAGSNYFNQPLLHSIATSLSITDAAAAFTVTVSQLAYALGLVLLVPLGDKLERRGLAVGLMVLAAIGLLLSGWAHSYPMLLAGTVMTGLFSVAAQTLVPMAATLSDPARSGRAVGLLMSGLLTGILAARSVAGLLSGVGGWSLVYRVAAPVMLVLAAALWFVLPRSRNAEPIRYAAVLRSLGALAREHPRLRSRALLGALSFASVSVLFSTMALLLAGPGHRLGDTEIGLVGAVGVAGALMASVAGRLADRGWVQATTGVSVALLLLGWGALALGGAHLGWFLLGFLLVDLGLPGVHISNQSVIYALAPQARSRINAVYMTCYFVGASAGSALGAVAWRQGGWLACCALGATLVLMAAWALWHDQRLTRRMRH
ncbi:MAG: MFS transporter [Comamonadaceae bacterium]|nr:MAG: MFS transporter [Comamonadaceae bacterium]